MSEAALSAYQQARAAQSVRNEARRIRTKVNDARGSRHDAGLRWPFELLQNALDAGPRPGKGGVAVTLKKSGTVFLLEHDGAYFSLPDLAALLSGGSSKEFESSETTGRFGTGFLATHVLAPRTRVSGLLEADGTPEYFSLELDRDGDEDDIVRNIDECSAAIAKAQRLAPEEIGGRVSARFEYIADDEDTLRLGLSTFRAAIPYLFGTCERLERVTVRVDGAPEERWHAPPARHVKRDSGHSVVERAIAFSRGESDYGDEEHTVIRVSAGAGAALAVVVNAGGTSTVSLPGAEVPRVFRRYPIRSSASLPMNVVLDAPFEVDQERTRLLADRPDVQALFRECLAAAVSLVRYAFEERLEGRLGLVHAAPCQSFFGSEDEEGIRWLNGELRSFAQAVASLPIVETRHGTGPAVSEDNGEWYADFLSPRLNGASEVDDVALETFWALANCVEDLYPPIESLCAHRSGLVVGWRALGLDLNVVTVDRIPEYIVDSDVTRIDELKVRGDKREWLARFVDLVGECWRSRHADPSVLDGVMPNQRGDLCPVSRLIRDNGVPDSLKQIATRVGLNVSARLLDHELVEKARTLELSRFEAAIAAAIPGEMSQLDLATQCVDRLAQLLPGGSKLGDQKGAEIDASIDLLAHLGEMSADVTTLAWRVPLVAEDDTVVHPTQQHRMVGPACSWPIEAKPFERAYPPNRLLRREYAERRGEHSVLDRLAAWGIAFPEPLSRASGGELKGDRLRFLAVEGEDVDGVQVVGNDFAQVALLTPEIINRCVGTDEAKALLGMVLCYLSGHDPSWRLVKKVTGRKSGEDVTIQVTDCLWLADLRSRAWVPTRTEQGKTILLMASAETLKPLLDAAWLTGNSDARELLHKFFGFDALELQLLGAAPDEGERAGLRDRLAQLVDVAGGDPDEIDAVVEELRAKRTRAADVARCRQFGLAVQAAIQDALKEQHLAVSVIDCGFDFEVSAPDAVEDASLRIEVGSYLVEVKATTQDSVRLTAKQAETATAEADRYVLCVVDLRGLPLSRLGDPWTAADVLPLATLVAEIGVPVQQTWELVDEARHNDISIRNEAALRFAVPDAIWTKGVSLPEWVRTTFRVAAAVASGGNEA